MHTTYMYTSTYIQYCICLSGGSIDIFKRESLKQLHTTSFKKSFYQQMQLQQES